MDDYTCVLWDQNIEETLHHLFGGCPFVQTCWDYVCQPSALNLSVHEAIANMKHQSAKPFYMEITILAA